jgi:hypothetical protein
MWDTSVIFKRLFVVNYRPLGKNLPNLVTLIRRYKSYLYLCSDNIANISPTFIWRGAGAERAEAHS